MTVKRVMGVETEYGISGQRGVYDDHTQLSFDLIRSVADLQPSTAHVRWDYGYEDPVHDARGFHMPRAHVRSDLLTDREQFRTTNVAYINGARIYVDHAHPEYSAPEVMTPREALVYDRAGDAIMARAAHKSQVSLKLFRNNVDGKGASWGSHENYQVARSVPFEDLATLFTAHAVSRIIYTGSGRVGLGEASQQPGFQISQRADYFKTPLGLQTTFDRPIVNTRDESHSTDTYRRFHVIAGDANRMDVPELLKIGTTSVLLWALEQSVVLHIPYADFLQEVTISDPVEAMHSFSHDLSLTQTTSTAHNHELSAFQVQLRLRSWVCSVAAQVYSTDSRGEPLWPDEDTKEVMHLWAEVLKDIARLIHADDDERLALREPARRVEWLTKWQIIESMRRRKNVNWDSPLMQALDISWAQLDSTSLWHKIEPHAQKIISAEDIEKACEFPPDDTRAYTRGWMLKNYPENVLFASWDGLVVRGASSDKSSDTSSDNQASTPVIIALHDPQGHARAEMGDTFTAEHKIEDIIERLV